MSAVLLDTKITAQKGYCFKNWAGIYSSKPLLYFQPTSIEQVQNIVNVARSQGKHIVTVGSGHTPNTLCLSNDWMMNLDKMDRILNIEQSKDHSYADVTMEAGIRVRDLNQYLNEKGYTLQNLPSISEPSVAGMISTGTHGSSAYHGFISSQVVNMTIVNGIGQEIFIDSDHEPELFKAMLLSLGKIAIIVKITLRVVPSFNLKCTQEIIEFDQLFENWDSLWISSEFVRVWWYPYTKKCILWKASKTSEKITKNPPKTWLSNRFWRFAYESMLYVCVRFYGPLTPYLERFVFGKLFKKMTSCVTTAINGFNIDCLFSQFVDEWGCPLEHGPEILRSIEHSILQAAQNKDFYVHSPMEIRCSNTTVPNTEINNIDTRTNTSLGPIYGNTISPYLDNAYRKAKFTPMDKVTNSQLTLFINATMYRPFHFNTPIGKWFTVFEDTISEAHGRPHWAKNFIGLTNFSSDANVKDHYLDYECRGLGTKIKEWYGDDLIAFQKIVAEQDPNHVFSPDDDWSYANGILQRQI